MNIDYGVASMIGLFTMIVLLGAIIYRSYSQKISIGDVLRLSFAKDGDSYTMMILIIINMAEAMLAASISPPNEVSVNPIARFFTHASISFVAIICGIMMVVEVNKLMLKWKKIKFPMLFTLKAGLLSFLTLWFPYINLTIIAKGLGEMDFMLGYLHTGNVEFLKQMTYVMYASLIMMASHYVLVVLEGFNLVASQKTNVLESIGIKPKDNRSVNEKINARDKQQKTEDVIRFLAKGYGYADDNASRKRSLDALVKRCLKQLDGGDDAMKAELGKALIKLKNDLTTAQKMKSGNKRDDKLKEVKGEIKELFSGKPTSAPYGFGQTLKSFGGN